MDFQIREDRERTRGRRALSCERAAYLRLVQHPLRDARRSAELMREPLAQTVTTLPSHLRPSPTWDQGPETGSHGVHTRDQFDAVAAELNSRPRKTLDWDTSAERLAKLLATCV